MQCWRGFAGVCGGGVGCGGVGVFGGGVVWRKGWRRVLSQRRGREGGCFAPSTTTASGDSSVKAWSILSGSGQNKATPKSGQQCKGFSCYDL